MLRQVMSSAFKLLILSLAAASLAVALLLLYHRTSLGTVTGTADVTTHTNFIVFFAWGELLAALAIYAGCCWLIAFAWHWLKGRLSNR